MNKLYTFEEIVKFPPGSCFKTIFDGYENEIYIVNENKSVTLFNKITQKLLQSKNPSMLSGFIQPIFFESDEKITFSVEKYVPLENQPDGWYELKFYGADKVVGYKKGKQVFVCSGNSILCFEASVHYGIKIEDPKLGKKYIFVDISNQPKNIAFKIKGFNEPLNLKYFFFVAKDTVAVVHNNNEVSIMDYRLFIESISRIPVFHIEVDFDEKTSLTIK